MFKVNYLLATLCKTTIYKFVCICIFIYCVSVYVWDEGACISMCMYEKVRNVFSGLCILTCVGDSDKTTIHDKCHGLWSNSLLSHGISVSDGVFAFTHLTRSEKQYQTGLRPLVCFQPEFATPFTLVMHQSHIWKKRKRKNFFIAGIIFFLWICALKIYFLPSCEWKITVRFECDAMNSPLTELALLVVCA